MFGIRPVDKPSAEDIVLRKVLDRGVDIPALRALTSAISSANEPIEVRQSAIALDANCILRLAAHRDSADVIDFLRTQHSAPLILPGQVIQEFWNNRFTAVSTMSGKIRNEFEKLKEMVEQVDPRFGSFGEEFADLLDKFDTDHGYVYEEGIAQKTSRMLEVLSDRALVPYVRRTYFEDVALQRNRTKTPPGFRDRNDNNGDFYVWADLLRGLQLAAKARIPFSNVVFVSEEKKDDWVRDSRPHPILSAEVLALTSSSFTIVDLPTLIRLVREAS